MPKPDTSTGAKAAAREIFSQENDGSGIMLAAEIIQRLAVDPAYPSLTYAISRRDEIIDDLNDRLATAERETGGWCDKHSAGVGDVSVACRGCQHDELLSWVKKAQLAERDLGQARERATVLEAALERSCLAIEDWINTYASEFCDEDRVAQARSRISGQGGTIAYTASVLEQASAALLDSDATEKPTGGEG